MRDPRYILLFLLFTGSSCINAQTGSFTVARTPFSTWANDEFSPVMRDGKIVFCTNLRDNSLAGYKDGQNRLFKIFYTEKKNFGWKSPELFSKELTSGMNDGPATFNAEGDIVYFSRNNSIPGRFRSVSDTLNRLGIYCATLVNGIWTNIKPFRYNDSQYSFHTPSLDPGGRRLYFCSDMPGGYGGMDIYYSDMNDDDWEKPVNLGPLVNTKSHESFPFAAMNGKLFFASEGHNGFGGKDLFYTKEINGIWISPVHLDSAINSPFDDFALIADSTLKSGYFSSNRLKSDDIFSFTSSPVDFQSCDSIRKNRYCYTFYDERHHSFDTSTVIYTWDFDGVIKTGEEVYHCFQGEGEFIVKLTITDKFSGDTIANQVRYDVKLTNFEQAVILSDNEAPAGKPVTFEGITSDLKDISITDYFWDFGAGFIPGGPKMTTSFRKKGDYIVRLGLLTRKDSLNISDKKCVMKKIKIN